MKTMLRSLGWLLPAFVLAAPALSAADVAYAVMFDNGPFWSAVARGLEAAGDPRLQAVLPPVPGPAAQIRYLEHAQQEHARIVALDPYWHDETRAALAALVGSGARIVALDNELPAEVPHVFVGHDKQHLNAEVGQLVARLIGDAGELALLRMQNERGPTAREQAAIDAVRALHPGVVVHADVFGAATADRAYAQTKLLLEKYPGTTVLLTTNTLHSLAALRAVREVKRSQSLAFVAYGVGLPDEVVTALREGAIHTWVAQDPYELGRRAATVMQDLLAGKPAPAATHVEAVMVTKANVDTPAAQALRR